jgi:hypothetical protein
MRFKLLSLAATVPLILALAPSTGTTLIDDATGEVIDLVEALDGDSFTSPNVTPVGALPNATVISTEFASDEPIMFASTLTGIETYDISDPTAPVLLGTLPMAFFQNENVKLGERFDAEGELIERFVLVGFDAAGVTPTEEPTDIGQYDEVVVVDVTDAADPQITARIGTNHRTHTVGCLNDECTHAVTSGDDNAFDVIDLTDIHDPFIATTVTDQPMAGNQGITSSVGHDWDVDDDGVAWWVGTGGIIAYDVSDPTDPVILNSSDEHGRDPEWNDYITHNSLRPNGDDFSGPRHHPGQGQGGGLERNRDSGSWSSDSGAPHVDRGNVLLITEEDYVDPRCGSAEGSFQTWYIPDLDPSINSEGEQDGGTITPLDQWNSEIAGTGIETPAGAFCSAHYFDYHQDGYVAQGWYQQGLRILDVNDPTDIQQVGYWITGVQETWGAYWVPEYDEDGRQTGLKTDLVYTNDPTRGMEILQVDLPNGEDRGTATAVTAPILTSWLEVDPTLEARKDETWGYVCPLPPSLG